MRNDSAQSLHDDCVLSVVWKSNRWHEQPVTASAGLITYNQERYVRQALESLLAQTHPLDVIISDDGSTDRTVPIIDEILHRYRGHHEVTLRHGKRRLGICRNQNHVFQTARGELVVLFEGDDVSLPRRVARIVETYLAHGRQLGALGSGILRVDEDGGGGEQVIWPRLRGDPWSLVRGDWTVSGCSLAIRRDCFSNTGPISRHLISGDIALWMRAAFARDGGLAQIPEALVHYRIHGANVSAGWRLDSASPQRFQASCRRLLKNEVAQVFELRKIARYRRSANLSDESGQNAWSALFRIARLRAELVMSVSRRSRLVWTVPAVRCLRHRALRSLAFRTLAMALFPSSRTLWAVIRRALPGAMR